MPSSASGWWDGKAAALGNPSAADPSEYCSLDGVLRIIQKKYDKIKFYPVEFRDHYKKRQNKFALEKVLDKIDNENLKKEIFKECVKRYNLNRTEKRCYHIDINGHMYTELREIFFNEVKNIIDRKNNFLIGYAKKEFLGYLLESEKNKFIYATSADGIPVIIEMDNRYCKSYRDRIERRARFLQWSYRKSQSVILTLTVDPNLYNNDKYKMWMDIKSEYNRFITALKYHFKKNRRVFPRYLSTIEAQKGRPENNYIGRGNPHMHIVFFGVARLLDWTKIRDLWKIGHIWINRSKDGKKIRYPINYIMKYICKTYTDTNNENLLTQSLCWLFNRRSFQCSRNLIIPLKPKNKDSSYIACFLFIVDDNIPIEYFRYNPWICEELTNPANYKFKDRLPRVINMVNISGSRYKIRM